MTLLVNLQDLLRFRVAVGLSICRNMVFVSLCRLVERHKELILIHGEQKITIVPRKMQQQQ